MTKELLRKQLKDKLKNIVEPKSKCLIIADKLFALPQIKKAKSLCVYNSFGTEVDTSLIIKRCYSEGKKVYIPRIIDESMRVCLWGDDLKLEKNSWGIIEPPIEMCGDDDFEVCIIPLLGFSEKGERLGRGKGYYDRFLKQRHCLKIAIAFEEQCVASGFSQPHDEIMDIVITEKRVLKLGNYENC